MLELVAAESNFQVTPFCPSESACFQSCPTSLSPKSLVSYIFTHSGKISGNLNVRPIVKRNFEAPNQSSTNIKMWYFNYWMKVSETTLGGWTQPRFADIFYMGMKLEPCNPKKIRVFKNKNTKPLPRIPRKILSKRNLFADLYWVQVSALMVSVTHGSAGITAICSMCPVTPACGMPNIYTEAGGGKSENSPRQWKASKSYGNLPFFQGNSQRSYTQLLDLALILVGTGKKQVHINT